MTWFSRAASLFVRSSGLYAVLERRRRALLRGEKKMAREIIAAYRNYESALDERLGKVAKLIHAAQVAGTDVNPLWLTEQSQVRELLVAIRAETQRFAEASATAIARRQKELVGLAGVDAIDLIKSTGVVGSLSRVPIEQLQDLVGILGSGSPLREIFAEFGEKAVRGAFVALTKTVGSGPATIARELHKELDGLSKHRALLIARTETNRTYRTATLRNFVANSDVVTGWRWASARDRRTCPICLAMDGSEHPLTEQMASHAACRCSMVPMILGYTPSRKTGEEWLRDQMPEIQQAVLGKTRYELWNSGQLTMREMVQQKPNFRWGPSTVLKPLRQLQSETALGLIGQQSGGVNSASRAVLIKTVRPGQIRRELRRIEVEYANSRTEVAHIFRSNGEIWRVDGDADSVTFHPDDSSLLFSSIVTHPHPSRVNHLSTSDILQAIDAQMGEIRATVLGKGIKRFTPPVMEVEDVLVARRLREMARSQAIGITRRKLGSIDPVAATDEELRLIKREFEYQWSKIFRRLLKDQLGIRFSS
ncbi:MAG: minor capsid protein [Chthonomonas sp.]|nr:minor capsid protein [Chthonomonas sp.]